MAGDQTKASLIRGIKSGYYSHAYIISCADEIKAHELVVSIAALICLGDETRNIGDNPDFITLDCDGLPIDKLREVMNELCFRPFSDNKRVVYLKGVHLLDEKKQNALLKTLEEPPDGTVFMLTGTEAGILPTIRSRCTRLRIALDADDDIFGALLRSGVSEADAERALMYCGGIESRANAICFDEAVSSILSDSVSYIETVLGGRAVFSLPKTISADRASARLSLEFMLEYMGNLLSAKTTFPNKVFTGRQISDIINQIAVTLMRIQQNDSIQQAFDCLAASVLEIV